MATIRLSGRFPSSASLGILSVQNPESIQLILKAFILGRDPLEQPLPGEFVNFKSSLLRFIVTAIVSAGNEALAGLALFTSAGR